MNKLSRTNRPPVVAIEVILPKHVPQTRGYFKEVGINAEFQNTATALEQQECAEHQRGTDQESGALGGSPAMSAHRGKCAQGEHDHDGDQNGTADIHRVPFFRSFMGRNEAPCEDNRGNHQRYVDEEHGAPAKCGGDDAAAAQTQDHRETLRRAEYGKPTMPDRPIGQNDVHQ